MSHIDKVFWSAWVVCVFGCSAGQAPVPAQVVMFDTATKQPYITHAADQYPAVHPGTGKPTLMPALYCPKCERWHVAPPPEEISRRKQPVTCSKCKGNLVPDGPLPSAP